MIPIRLSFASLLALMFVLGSADRAHAGTYGNTVVLSPPTAASSKVLAPGLADLQNYLAQMTGSAFGLKKIPGASSISLLLTKSAEAPADAVRRLAGKGIDAFVIAGDAENLRIVANDEHGLVNGIDFYLERLGMRWLLPGPNWTVIPKRADIALSIDRFVAPSFKVRSYAGTGGFYSWKWGRSHPGSATFETETRDWQRRLGYGGEYTLGKDVGAAFVADRKINPILKEHPEYLAKVDDAFSPLFVVDKAGQTRVNVAAKLNAGSPEAVALFCGWVVDRLRVARAGPDVVRHAVISVEPSDGMGYGTDIASLPGNGSPSDQTFFIANACARQVRVEFPDASVILLAYAGHAAPPSFALEPNVIVQVTPFAFQDAPPRIFINDWSRKARRLAIYDYWSIPDWTHDEPSFDFTGLSAKLRDWRSSGIESINTETTYGAGAMGLGHYLAAHLMWDLSLNQRSLEDDWFENAFGTAKAPMKRMIERWARSFKLTSAEIGASYKDLLEAQRLAAKQPDIVARVDDFVRYTQYLRLRLELANSQDPAHTSESAVAIAAYLLSIEGTAMTHTTRLIDLYARQYPDIFLIFDLAKRGDPQTAWAGIHPLSREDVSRLLTDGAAAYPPPDFEQKSDAAKLVPLNPMSLPHVQAGSWNSVMPVVGDLTLEFVVPAGLESIPFRLTRKVGNDVSISDEVGRLVATHHVDRADDDAWDAFDVPLRPGRYRMSIHPAGGRARGYFSIQTMRGLPLVMRSFLSPKPAPSPRLFFYVPRNLQKLAISMSDGDFGNAFKFRVLDSDGQPVAVERRDGGRMQMVDIPPGQSGRIWSVVRVVAPNVPIELLNAPQAFALTPDTLMVPSEAAQTP